LAAYLTNLRNTRFAWECVVGREDSNLQPDRYERPNIGPPHPPLIEFDDAAAASFRLPNLVGCYPHRYPNLC
jgi:hypothetical protein